MSKTMIKDQVVGLIDDHMEDGKKATLETKILSDTTMDSVKVMDFILELEDEFDMTIPLNRLAEVETVGDLVYEIEKLYQAK